MDTDDSWVDEKAEKMINDAYDLFYDRAEFVGMSKTIELEKQIEDARDILKEKESKDDNI